MYGSYSWVESVFGLSRSFLALQARVSQYGYPSSNAYCAEQIVPQVCFFLSRIARTRTGEITEEARTNLNNLKECRELYNSLESWRQGIPGLPARVYSGNIIYAKASQVCRFVRTPKPIWFSFDIAKILLLRDIFRFDPTDSIVQECVQTILNLSLQCTAIKMGVEWVSTISSLSQTILNLRISLIWPVIIAGSHSYGTDRIMVTEVFKAFRYVSEWSNARILGWRFTRSRTQCCYEIDTSANVVQQVSTLVYARENLLSCIRSCMLGLEEARPRPSSAGMATCHGRFWPTTSSGVDFIGLW